MTTQLAVLFDVDNTLVDNDRVKEDMDRQTQELLSQDRAQAFWKLYEDVREELGFVDVPRTLERFSAAFPDEPRFPELAAELLCFPYHAYLFPGALEAIEYGKSYGTVAIVSDGDRVFQPAKIGRAGLAAAVDHRVLIFAHKDQEFERVEDQLPAGHYVLVDDKPQILASLKEQLSDRLTTVLVRQGKYAQEPAPSEPDVELASIADFVKVNLDAVGVASGH